MVNVEFWMLDEFWWILKTIVANWSLKTNFKCCKRMVSWILNGETNDEFGKPFLKIGNPMLKTNLKWSKRMLKVEKWILNTNIEFW